MQKTLLSLHDKLPLTCSRSGICCHGNKVMLNAWELACMAHAKQLSLTEFRDQYTHLNGTRLLFSGHVGYQNKQACQLYVKGKGCSIHPARPLACRLFPLGLQIHNGSAAYFYQGTDFPCLNGCNEVLNLPFLTVEKYIDEQKTHDGEVAQQAYLELMQQLADISFELLLESGLAASGDTSTLHHWRKMATEPVDEISTRIGSEWLDVLTVPQLPTHDFSPEMFCQLHTQLIQQHLECELQSLNSLESFQKAAVLVMSLAVFIASSIGTDTQPLMEHWITVAKANGAQE